MTQRFSSRLHIENKFTDASRDRLHIKYIKCQACYSNFIWKTKIRGESDVDTLFPNYKSPRSLCSLTEKQLSLWRYKDGQSYGNTSRQRYNSQRSPLDRLNEKPLPQTYFWINSLRKEKPTWSCPNSLNIRILKIHNSL